MEGLQILSFNEKIHTINLCGEVNEEMLKNLAERISEIRSDDNNVAINNFGVLQSIGLDVSISLLPITITLSTFGGDIYSCLGIYDTIKDLQKTYTVNIICNGYCMSAGTIILLAADKKHRFAYENCTFLIHTLSSYTAGKIRTMEEDNEESKRLHKLMWQIYKDETKIPENVLNDIYKCKKDLFIDTKQAKKWGLISEVT